MPAATANSDLSAIPLICGVMPFLSVSLQLSFLSFLSCGFIFSCARTNLYSGPGCSGITEAASGCIILPGIIYLRINSGIAKILALGNLTKRNIGG